MSDREDRLRATVVARVLAALDALASLHSITALEAMVAARDFKALYSDVDRTYASISEIAIAVYLMHLAEVAPTVSPSLVVNTSTWRVANDQAVVRTNLAQAFADDQKRVLAKVISESYGMAHRLVAVRLRDALGLTQPLAEAVLRYGRVAGMTSRSEVEAKNLVTPDQVATMTRAMAANYRKARAESLGLAESQRARGRAELEAWRQGGEQNLIDRNRVKRIWHVTHHNTRDSHISMDNQERGLDVPFVSGHGNHLMYPCDGAAPVNDVANCNCWITYGLR